jgi:SecD/SecF fusion protein
MNGSLLLLAAAVTEPAAAAAAMPWWREGWAAWPIAIATVVVPSVVAWLLARALRVSDMWGRIAVVLTSLAVAAVVIALGWPPRLGIDLKGGVILVYEVDTAKQAATAREAAEGEGAAADGEGETAGEAGMPAGRIDMDKLVAAVSRRVNPGGQKEVTVRQYGLDQIEVIVPAVDQAETDLIKRVVSSAGVLEFRITANPDDPRHKQVIEAGTRATGSTVSEAGRPVGRWVELDAGKMGSAEQRGLVTRSTPDGRTEALVVLDRFNVTGGFLTRALSSYDQNLQPCVNFSFNSAGSSLFGALTGANLPDPANQLTSRLGIVLDDVLLSAPTIRSAISSSGQITGSFKQEDVNFLVGVLNAGSLPAALVSEPVSEQSISPQLGVDTIRSGARAMLLATAAVLLFMLAYYRFAGFVADLAVLLNVVLVLAFVISLKAALTLAGLAGLVLSVGMAVDANVLIYERIREELDRGAALRMAIRNGFQRAFSTIVDSNLTTLITGFVLFAIGTDQLKGFAVTLILGLTLNLFTAVFCSRVLFDLAERTGWIKRLSMARLFGKTDIPFVSWMGTAMAFSLALLVLGGAAAYFRGQGLFDIDFTGGSSVQVEFREGQELSSADVRKAVATLPDAAVSSMQSPDVPEGSRYKIDTSVKDQKAVENLLQEAFPGRLKTQSMGYGKIESSAAKPAAEGGPQGEKSETGLMPTTVVLDFPERISLPRLQAAVEAAMAAEGLGGSPFQLEAEEMTTRSKPYRTWTLATAVGPEPLGKVVDRMAKEMADVPVYLSSNAIGGKVAGNTQVTAVYALVASVVMIVLYVWLRFQNVAFGLAAVVALVHDVLVTVALIAMSQYLSPYLGWALVDDFKISLDVVAALLTIVGFSINDTIVIFDRLREIRGKSPTVSAAMIDKAVNQTLSRTILTSGTAFIATFILYLFGGQGIHAFAFTMLVGIVTGSYSTIFIASPIVLWLQQRSAAPAGRPSLTPT